MENKNTGGFTPPQAANVEPFEGAAEVPTNKGKVTKKSLTEKSSTEEKSKKRNIKVEATDKGFFDFERKEIGDKFMVSEQEFSEKWMIKI